MTLLAPLITGYLRDYMPRQRGYSPHSCETYAYGFRLLFTFAAKRTVTRPSQLHLEQLDAKLILGFLTHIEGERGNGAATRNLRLAAIKSFMCYVEYRRYQARLWLGVLVCSAGGVRWRIARRLMPVTSHRRVKYLSSCSP